MKASLLKCAAVVAGVIFGANGSFAADNVWTYYAKDAENNPTGGGLTNCIVQGNWVIAATYDASQPAKLTIGLPIEGSGALNFWDMKIGDAAITDVGMSSLAYDSGCATGITEFRMNHFTGAKIPRFGKTDISDVLIEGSATEISGYANTWGKITYGAFQSCTNLKSCVIDCPIKTIGQQAFSGCTSLTGDLMKIVKPYTTSVGADAFLSAKLGGELILTNFQEKTIPRFTYLNISNVYIKGTSTAFQGVAWSVPGSFAKCTNLQVCVIDCPITMVGGQAFDGCKALTSDVMKIIRPYTATFGEKTFADVPLTGDLVLTNVTSSSFSGYAFSGGQFSSVKLGGSATSLTVGEWGGTPYHNFSADVKNYELEFTNLTSVTRFVLRGVTNLTICGSAENWTKGMIDVLIGNVAAVASSEEKGKACTIYCSKKQGWRTKFASKLEGKEADYAPIGHFGVYESETATSGKVITSVGRKAWLVHKAMPGDPTGLCIRVQ